jgi:hypothetical protein
MDDLLGWQVIEGENVGAGGTFQPASTMFTTPSFTSGESTGGGATNTGTGNFTPVGVKPAPSNNTPSVGGIANMFGFGGTPSSGANIIFSLASAGDYFTRAVVIVVGLIFLAIGLNMMRPGTVPVPPMRTPVP